eukprot:9473069-Pyramimonas_sp.AAC.1
MPAIGDCPVDPEKLDYRRRAYAVDAKQGLTVDRVDNWRGKESQNHRPCEYISNVESSDGDYCLSRWTGYTEFWI